MPHEDLLFIPRKTYRNNKKLYFETDDGTGMSSNKAENNVSLKPSAEDELSRFRHKMLCRELGCEQRGRQQMQSREIKQGGRGTQQHREVCDGSSERLNRS